MKRLLLAALFLAVLLGGCAQDRRCGDPARAERMEQAHQKQN